jgi:hypothetical protein
MTRLIPDFSLKKFFMTSNSMAIGLRSFLILFSATLFSFSPKKGGDSFEIWLNGKRVLQQYVHVAKGVQTLHLTPVSDNDKLDIYYSHCGQIGNSRYITIKDEKNHAIKVWKFIDAAGGNTAMSFKVKDILGLKKNRTDKLGLYYSSHQLPEGRLLAIIDSENETGVARK